MSFFTSSGLSTSNGPLTLGPSFATQSRIAEMFGLPPPKPPFVPERLISPIPGDHKLDNAWTIEPGTIFAFVGKMNESVLADQQNRRAQYGDPLPIEVLAQRYNVPPQMMGDLYLRDLIQRTQYYPEEQYLVDNRINENNHPPQDNSPLAVLTRAFDPAQNGLAASAADTGNKIAQALDPNQNGLAASAADTGNKIQSTLEVVKNTIVGTANEVKETFVDTGNQIKEGTIDVGLQIKDGFVNEALPVLEDIGQVLLETVVGGGSPPPRLPAAPKAPPRSVSAVGSLFPFLAMGGGILAVLILFKNVH